MRELAMSILAFVGVGDFEVYHAAKAQFAPHVAQYGFQMGSYASDYQNCIDLHFDLTRVGTLSDYAISVSSGAVSIEYIFYPLDLLDGLNEDAQDASSDVTLFRCVRYAYNDQLVIYLD